MCSSHCGNLRVQISWQAQHFVACQGVGCTPWRRLASAGHRRRFRGRCSTLLLAKGSDVRPGVVWRRVGSGADFVAGAALWCLPRGRMYALASSGVVWAPAQISWQAQYFGACQGVGCTPWRRLASSGHRRRFRGRRSTFGACQGVGCTPWRRLASAGHRRRFRGRHSSDTVVEGQQHITHTHRAATRTTSHRTRSNITSDAQRLSLSPALSLSCGVFLFQMQLFPEFSVWHTFLAFLFPTLSCGVLVFLAAPSRSSNISHTTYITHNNISHTTSLTQHPTHNISHATSLTQHLSHNISHTTSHTQHLSRNISHTTSLTTTSHTQHHSHNIPHTTSRTQHHSHNISHNNISHTTSLTQHPTHNVSHATSLTQHLSQQHLTHTTSLTQHPTHNISQNISNNTTSHITHNISRNNISHTTSLTQHPTHNVSHTTSLTQHLSQQHLTHNITHTTSHTQHLTEHLQQHNISHHSQHLSQQHLAHNITHTTSHTQRLAHNITHTTSLTTTSHTQHHSHNIPHTTSHRTSPTTQHLTSLTTSLTISSRTQHHSHNIPHTTSRTQHLSPRSRMYALASAGHRRSAGSICCVRRLLLAKGSDVRPGVGWAPALCRWHLHAVRGACCLPRGRMYALASAGHQRLMRRFRGRRSTL